LNQVQRLSVDLDKSFTSLCPSCQYSIHYRLVFAFVPCSGRQR
jgi:hypothetical protein